MTVITRENQEADVLYVLPDGTAFVTPDGLGRYWYDSEEEGEEDYAFIERTEYIDGVAND
ncbi:hypothetical protein [Streptomyces phage phiScoe10]|nr:hypothetical protein [Streptomyces phage phiScoe10]